MALDKNELERFQLERFKEIVNYAYENVEMYNKKWGETGVHPHDIQTLDDISKLPIITKDDLKYNYPDDILSKQCKPEDCFIIGTTGSTGSAIKIFVDIEKALFDFAVSIPNIMAGLPEISVARAIRDYIFRRNITNLFIIVNDPSAYETLHGKIFWPMKHTIIDSLQSPEFHIQEINKRKPKYIFSYPSVIRNLLIVAKEKGIKLHQPSLIMVVGENLDENLRNLVKKTFNIEMLDSYGTTETGYVASECLYHSGMHLFSWKVITELIDENDQGVPEGIPGRIIITDLFNKATPIIRYNGLGDYAVWKKDLCPCGMSLPLIERIEGRIIDAILLPDKRIIHPYNLTLILQDIPYLRKFQIRQERLDYLEILIVKDRTDEAKNISFSSESELGQVIIGKFNKILNNQVEVAIEVVQDIPRQPGSHKYATVLSFANDQRSM